MWQSNGRRLIGLILIIVIVQLVFNGSAKVLAQDRIKASEAGQYVGKQATVCGTVASAKYAATSKGSPTFLNLDSPYPNQIFTVVIWGENRDKFKTPPEQGCRGKRICVTGTITTFRNIPQIVLNDPSQISMED